MSIKSEIEMEERGSSVQGVIDWIQEHEEEIEKIVDHSACVDPANYDAAMGVEICERKVKDQLWAFEGYKLQCELGKL